MSKLDSLKIKECPYAFASFAEKHNALIEMLEGITGQNGITVVLAEKNGVIRSNNSASISGNVSQVVTSVGSLANAYTANIDANAFPTVGKWVTANGNITINDAGLTILTASGKTCTIAFASLTQNLALRTDQYCNSGASQNIMIVASSPF